MRYPTKESADRNLAALTVTCPYCKAAPHADCQSTNLWTVWPPHKSRITAGIKKLRETTDAQAAHFREHTPSRKLQTPEEQA